MSTLTVLMVLDLKPPSDAAAGGLLHGIVLPLLPKLLTYAVTFAVIAILWMQHHMLFHRAAGLSRALFWRNMLLLFCMSLIPVATDALGDNPHEPAAAAWYGAVLCGVAASFVLLWHHVAPNGRRKPPVEYLVAVSLYAVATLFTAAGGPSSPALVVFAAVPLLFVVSHMRVATA